MKTKKIISALIAGILAATAVVSASAVEATKELTDVTPENSTEVKANIVDPGSVSYTITIPETADFGTLTQPDSTENDNYTFYGFEVKAAKLNIKSNQGVSVYMKDSTADDNQFYISQKDVADPFTIAYNVYDAKVDGETIGNYDPINTTAVPGAYGYHLCTFLYGSEGRTQPVTLALNQNALYGQNLSDIAGDYSGTITFHSALIER